MFRELAAVPAFVALAVMLVVGLIRGGLPGKGLSYVDRAESPVLYWFAIGLLAVVVLGVGGGLALQIVRSLQST